MSVLFFLSFAAFVGEDPRLQVIAKIGRALVPVMVVLLKALQKDIVQPVADTFNPDRLLVKYLVGNVAPVEWGLTGEKFIHGSANRPLRIHPDRVCA